MAERARGSLLGLAWGDVLGCPVEGWREAEIARAFAGYPGLPAAYPLERIDVSRRSKLRPLGLHSDDTQQATALIGACLAGWSPREWGRRLVEGEAAKAWRGTGRHFDAAVRKLAKGAAPEVAGSPSAGIGAAMRVAPLGALYFDDPRKLAEVAMESSAVTHAELRAMALAYAVAHASALLVQGLPAAQVQEVLPEAVSAVEDEWLTGRGEWPVDRSGGHQVSLCLARLFSSMPRDLKELGARICGLAKPHLAPPAPGGAHAGDASPAAHPSDGPPRAGTNSHNAHSGHGHAPLVAAPRGPHPNDGFALLGGLHGLAIGLHPDVEPAAALLAMVRQGSDTDTVAAIAGGLLGARFGVEWIPRRELLDRDRLERYASALVDRSTPPESFDDWCRREADFTRQERNFQPRPPSAVGEQGSLF